MIQNPKIAIIDYGVGNLYNIAKAFGKFTQNCVIIDNSSDLRAYDAIILPGVGAFKVGMNGLKKRGLFEEVKRFASFGRPILGICLGAQMLLSRGYEFGVFDGLDIIKGETIHFSNLKDMKKYVNIPHIGWNEIKTPTNVSWNNTILDSIPKKANMYFAHSYILKPADEKNIFSMTDYEGVEFCSTIKEGNIYGCQFHPEKSGEFGLKIIQNFVNLI